MKAEDVNRLLRESLRNLGRDRTGGSITLTRAHLRSFARACEQHGVERAKAGIKPLRLARFEGRLMPVGVDWSALDAEIRKENEGDR